jgi:uncharacterized protein YkwD
MRRSTTLLVALLLALPALAAFSASTSARTKLYLPLVACPGCTATTSPINPDPSTYVGEAVRLVNEARLAAGCPAALPHPALMAATQAWTEYMERTSDYQHAPAGHYSQAPYFYSDSLLENIGGGYSPSNIVSAWLGSIKHKANLEFCYPPGDPSYNPERIYDIGVGYSGGYWTLAIGWE